MFLHPLSHLKVKKKKIRQQDKTLTFSHKKGFFCSLGPEKFIQYMTIFEIFQNLYGIHILFQINFSRSGDTQLGLLPQSDNDLLNAGLRNAAVENIFTKLFFALMAI